MDAGDEIDVVRPADDDSSEEICPEQDHGGRSEPTSLKQGEILRTLATVEKDSQAIAESFSSLFVSLRSTLSEATGCSVDHMGCFGDSVGRLQESALDAATKGNRYINSCLRAMTLRSMNTLNKQSDFDADLLPTRLFTTDIFSSDGRLNSYSKPEYLLDVADAFEDTTEFELSMSVPWF